MPSNIPGIAIAGAFLFAAAATSCVPAQPQASMNVLTPVEREQGWRLLFDGETTNGWRGYGEDRVPDGWHAVDGALVRTATGAGDIITTDRFRNFELVLQWKLGPGGNSGIFYRAVETDREIWRTAPEMQVLDDERHPDGRSELTSAGALYALHGTTRGVVRPAGSWNDVRIVLNGSHGEHWLNGTKLFEFGIGSPDWDVRVRASKFASEPGFGRNAEGHIGLQDHEPAQGYGGPEDRVEFRNIKIRVLP